jgi:hypothetical protein
MSPLMVGFGAIDAVIAAQALCAWRYERSSRRRRR